MKAKWIWIATIVCCFIEAHKHKTPLNVHLSCNSCQSRVTYPRRFFGKGQKALQMNFYSRSFFYIAMKRNQNGMHKDISTHWIENKWKKKPLQKGIFFLSLFIWKCNVLYLLWGESDQQCHFQCYCYDGWWRQTRVLRFHLFSMDAANEYWNVMVSIPYRISMEFRLSLHRPIFLNLCLINQLIFVFKMLNELRLNAPHIW